MAFDKTRYNSEYNRSKYKSFAVRFNLESEQDIIDYLQHQNLKSYLTDLIRADMKRDGKRRGTIKGPEYRHNHPDVWCYEVIEDLPNDHYSIGYAESLDEAKEMILDYLKQGTPAGMIYIAERIRNIDAPWAGGIQAGARGLK